MSDKIELLCLLSLLILHLLFVNGGFLSNSAVLGKDFVHIKTLLRYFIKIAKHGLSALAEDHDLVNLPQKLKLMGDEDHTLVSQYTFDSMIEDTICYGWVNC